MRLDFLLRFPSLDLGTAAAFLHDSFHLVRTRCILPSRAGISLEMSASGTHALASLGPKSRLLRFDCHTDISSHRSSS